MEKSEVIERLERIAEHAVHIVGEPPLVLSLDDGIAIEEAVEALNATVEAIPTAWIVAQIQDTCGAESSYYSRLLKKWREEQNEHCN